MPVLVYGSSDDLIEVEGDLREEFSPHREGEPSYLAFSDGTVLSVEYTQAGFWRINRLERGTAKYSKWAATDPDGQEYSDRVTLNGQFEWVICGQAIARKPSTLEKGDA